MLENDGIYDATGQPEPTYPTLAEASGITAQTIMFHGSGDPVVHPSASKR